MWNPFESPSSNEEDDDNAPRENALETRDDNISTYRNTPQGDDDDSDED